MTAAESRPALARRLRELREEEWPDLGITQGQLGQALGGAKPLSVSLISSWENVDKPVAPPVHRLSAYATLFATRRSISGGGIHLLPVAQLTADERQQRDRLLAELKDLRDGKSRAAAAAQATDVWRFPEDEDVIIVCAQLPEELRHRLSYADPDSPDFVSLYRYADPDALIELYAHLRVLNPDNKITYKTTKTLVEEDYTAHLVLLGGVDWNFLTRQLLDWGDLPVEQVVRDDEHENGHLGGFRVSIEGRTKLFTPKLDAEGRLLEDVAHFYHGPSPMNQKRTVSVCNGMYGRGTLGAVQALTHKRFKARNQEYIEKRFDRARPFSIISRVRILGGNGIPPDWTLAKDRLHVWPERTA